MAKLACEKNSQKVVQKLSIYLIGCVKIVYKKSGALNLLAFYYHTNHPFLNRRSLIKVPVNSVFLPTIHNTYYKDYSKVK